MLSHIVKCYCFTHESCDGRACCQSDLPGKRDCKWGTASIRMALWACLCGNFWMLISVGPNPVWAVLCPGRNVAEQSRGSMTVSRSLLRFLPCLPSIEGNLKAKINTFLIKLVLTIVFSTEIESKLGPHPSKILEKSNSVFGPLEAKDTPSPLYLVNCTLIYLCWISHLYGCQRREEAEETASIKGKRCS